MKMYVNDYFDKLTLSVIKLYRRYCSFSSFKHYKKLLKLHNIPFKKLSKKQKKEVDAVWNGCGKYNYNTHSLVYSITNKFDPKIVPENLFRNKIELNLNNQSFKNAWADKSYFSWWFNKELFPDNVVININGVFYNNDYQVINKAQALELINTHDKLIIKSSLDSGFGKGVKMLNIKEDDIESILDSYGKNYVVQMVFKQHEIPSSFNPSSVNVVRFISMFINGEVYPLMSAMRCGAEGQINDNSVTKNGLGMFVIGIDNDGTLKDKAVHSCGKLISKCPNGTEFAGKKIPGYDKMKEIIKEYHSKLPYFKFVGWDFVIDKNGNPKIMEYNIKGPGILYYQYVNGPLFGEHTDLLIDYIKNA